MGMDQAHASQLDDGVIDLAAGPDADADADATPSDSDGSYSTESGKSDDAFVAPDDIDQSHVSASPVMQCCEGYANVSRAGSTKSSMLNTCSLL